MIKKMRFLIHYLFIVLTLTSLQAADDRAEETFSIRKTQLDRLMKHLDALTPPAIEGLTCIDLHNVCKSLQDLYAERSKFNTKHHLVDPACENVYNSALMEMVRDGQSEQWAMGGGAVPIFPLMRRWPGVLEALESGISFIKADILESIGIYEKLYGPHPRRAEFL
ncbi:MAG: hypothetical protein K0R52_168 [Alphaproteobacteria bacterium]|jgi:hypothetical protein|nr:hypothetical protein [Alphaproteobacteria bacterium]